MECFAVASAEQSALIKEAGGKHQDTWVTAVVGEESGDVGTPCLGPLVD